MEQLKKYHEQIKEEIQKFFDEEIITKKEDLQIYEYLKEYSLRGKLIRGSLILLINEALTNQNTQKALTTATALEILHSSILIIDDIIDQDDIRRNKPAIHITTKELIPLSQNKEHDAQSIAQCVGLIGTYSAYKKLSQTSPKIINQLSEELTKTGFAELNEVILAQKNVVTKEDVMNIYKYKTAKYTITLPFKLAYILSEKEFTQELEIITDNIGILFQIKDDLLELEQDTENIGKSNTSDIQAGKQHYPRKVLEESTTQEDLKIINDAYQKLDDASVKKLQELYKKYEVVKKTNTLIKELKTKTTSLIEAQNETIKPILKELLIYVVERTY